MRKKELEELISAIYEIDQNYHYTYPLHFCGITIINSDIGISIHTNYLTIVSSISMSK